MVRVKWRRFQQVEDGCWSKYRRIMDGRCLPGYGSKRIRIGKKTPPLGRAYVTVMKEKEIWGRVEFLWDKVNGRLIFFDHSFQSRTDQGTSYIRFSLFKKRES